MTEQSAEMGKLYFKIDGTTESRDKLIKFFEDWGFKSEPKSEVGDEYYKRGILFTNSTGFSVYVIWFINLVYIKIGEWGKGFMEVTFTEIVGSYVPYVDHNTFDFIYDKNRVLVLAIPRRKND
jgi:hypothetical protein